MNNIGRFAVVALSLTILGGCAAAQKVTSKLDYSTGIYVSQQQVDGFKKGKTNQSDVIAIIGNPPQKSEIMGREVWTYTYTLIPAMPFKPNKFENTVVEFDKKGILVNVYKTGGTPGQSGNPLVNAAGI